jgi:hypothetical protein
MGEVTAPRLRLNAAAASSDCTIFAAVIMSLLAPVCDY